MRDFLEAFISAFFIVVFTLAFGLFGTVLLFQSEPHTTEQTTEACSYD